MFPSMNEIWLLTVFLWMCVIRWSRTWHCIVILNMNSCSDYETPSTWDLALLTIWSNINHNFLSPTKLIKVVPPSLNFSNRCHDWCLENIPPKNDEITVKIVFQSLFFSFPLTLWLVAWAEYKMERSMILALLGSQKVTLSDSAIIRPMIILRMSD